MSEVTGWLLAAIAVILFYKLVERRHKILLFKILGSGVLLIGAVLLWAFLSERRQDEREARLLASVTAAVDSYSDSALALSLCNRGSLDLHRVQVATRGFELGRSTPRKILGEARGSWDTDTRLTSDIIIPAGTCSIIVWSASLHVFDSLEADVRAARFADGKQVGYFSEY